MNEANDRTTTGSAPAAAAPGFALSDHMARMALELFDARKRCLALAETLEAVQRAHLAAHREAERIGAVPPLTG